MHSNITNDLSVYLAMKFEKYLVSFSGSKENVVLLVYNRYIAINNPTLQRINRVCRSTEHICILYRYSYLEDKIQDVPKVDGAKVSDENDVELEARDPAVSEERQEAQYGVQEEPVDGVWLVEPVVLV